MSEIMTLAEIQNYDPTRTTGLRNEFVRQMKRKFTELCIVVKKSIVDKDCFGLTTKAIEVNQMSPTLPGQFDFGGSGDKLQSFMKWLDEQISRGILDVRVLEQVGSATNSAWMNLYLFDSYKRGVMRARTEMRKIGIDVPIDEMAGDTGWMVLPMHMDRIGLIYNRFYNELKGITDAMDAQISRILAQGLANGDGPIVIARNIVSTINGENLGSLAITDTLGRFIPAKRRAEILARTEVIRSHHLATIQEYRNWGVMGIKVKGEWKTAGDSRVCDKCASMDGKLFTLDEIENKIPLHPQCRCIALPYIEELNKYIAK